jgi:hypothetical protein
VLALAIGLPAVLVRGRALKGPLGVPEIRRRLAADGAWGTAAPLWVVTGALRAFAGLEKGAANGAPHRAERPAHGRAGIFGHALLTAS